MPFLRFARDKRGYESTFLVHTVRRRGKSRQRILYWFRTPPDVKVGRSALDEDAIRSIEEHNPQLLFDWAKILEVQPAPAPAPEDARTRRGRGARGERRESGPAQPSAPQPSAARARQARAPGRRSLSNPVEVGAEDREIVRAADEIEEQLDIADRARAKEETRPAVEAVAGREQLTRLRARFAELQARITERGGDAARIDALRVQAEPLDPDTWVTVEEARKGLEEFERGFQELRRQLGLGKRTRSRRGGVRRRRRRTGGAGQAPSAASQGAASTDGRQAGGIAMSGEAGRQGQEEGTSGRTADSSERNGPGNDRT